MDLIKTSTDQKLGINCTWSGFHYDILNMKSGFKRMNFH